MIPHRSPIIYEAIVIFFYILYSSKFSSPHQYYLSLYPPSSPPLLSTLVRLFDVKKRYAWSVSATAGLVWNRRERTKTTRYSHDFLFLSFYIPWSASASPDYVQCGFNLSSVCVQIIHCIHFLSKSILQSLSAGVPPSVKLIDVMRADPLIRYALKLLEVYLTT